MARACIFCGSTDNPITKEHIIGDWVSNLFKGYGPATAGIISRDGTVKSFRVQLFQQKSKNVCAKCNGGWMSRLENGVKPFLGPMLLDGKATSLDAGMQRLLATWSIKTALVLQGIHTADRIVPDSEYRKLYEVQQPIRGYGVWLAHRTSYKDSTGRELIFASAEEVIYRVKIRKSDIPEMEGAIRDGRKAFVITFALGRVVFQVFGHNMIGNFVLGNVFETALQWIWPLQGDIVWPPVDNLESIEGGLFGLHRAFTGPPPAQ